MGPHHNDKLELDLRQMFSDPQYKKYFEFGYYKSRSNNVANFDLKNCLYWTFFYYTHSISAKYIYTGSVVVMCILKTM